MNINFTPFGVLKAPFITRKCFNSQSWGRFLQNIKSAIEDRAHTVDLDSETKGTSGQEILKIHGKTLGFTSGGKHSQNVTRVCSFRQDTPCRISLEVWRSHRSTQVWRKSNSICLCYSGNDLLINTVSVWHTIQYRKDQFKKDSRDLISRYSDAICYLLQTSVHLLVCSPVFRLMSIYDIINIVVDHNCWQVCLFFADKIVDSASTLMRILFIKDLRELQSQIDEAIVRVQASSFIENFQETMVSFQGILHLPNLMYQKCM